jgi:hypothetical protein
LGWITVFLYALRREVLRNLTLFLFGGAVSASAAPAFLYALRREVLRNVTITEDEAADTDRCFYTPFGVRCFGTLPPWTGR